MVLGEKQIQLPYFIIVFEMRMDVLKFLQRRPNRSNKRGYRTVGAHTVNR